MHLKAIMQNPSQGVVLYELIPPKVGDAREREAALALIADLRDLVDGINIPEIHEESRRGARPARLPQRVEPRRFARDIQQTHGVETVVNRVTVHDPSAEAQGRWMQETWEEYGVRSLILVGGESSAVSYPGPGVLETASRLQATGPDFLLGGITIPSRSREAVRVREKYQHGVRFFTTQVLFDSNDIVDLIQSLNGLDARILLSFAPVSNSKDVEFLEWLGVDVPSNLSWRIAQEADAARAVERSIAQAESILADVFDNLPPHPPALGINVEQITRRNAGPSLLLLTRLRTFYRRMLLARHPQAAGPWETVSSGPAAGQNVFP